jgi:hypothetical protein
MVNIDRSPHVHPEKGPCQQARRTRTIKDSGPGPHLGVLG